MFGTGHPYRTVKPLKFYFRVETFLLGKKFSNNNDRMEKRGPFSISQYFIDIQHNEFMIKGPNIYYTRCTVSFD